MHQSDLTYLHNVLAQRLFSLLSNHKNTRGVSTCTQRLRDSQVDHNGETINSLHT